MSFTQASKGHLMNAENGRQMGRPKKFEREVLKEKANEVFWAKGYEATSISDLADASGFCRDNL